ncbi:MAG: 23S rRNA (guanosine(2251)-2'-O)-methyltransferase RlmB [Gammaproteobacteria bacterium]
MSKEARQEHTVFGVHAVKSAIRQDASLVREVWAIRGQKNRRVLDLVRDAERAGIRVEMLSKQVFEERVGDVRHQGIAARGITPSGMTEGALFDLLSALDVAPFLLVLDGVQDPHNLGACLRTADAAGVHAVVAPRDKAVGLTPVVSKVASGAAETVPFVQVANLSRFLERLADSGVFIIGLAGEGEQSLFDLDLRGPLALIMGAEGDGIRRLTAKHCDQLARLPMLGAVESLNVSVAAGVSVYEALRQRAT